MTGLNHIENFLASYKQYKKDTEYIAGWLAEASASVGHEVEKTALKRKPKKRPGQTAAQAREKAQNAKAYIIKVSDFVPMAEAIANGTGDERAMVPVATRRKVANWFKFKVDSDEDSNKRHHYFITVLEDAFRVLRPFIALGPQTARTTEDDATRSVPLDLDNRFANLTVEEVVEVADEVALETKEKGLPDVARVILQRSDEEVLEELKVAFGLLLQDNESMLQVVLETWAKYKTGETDYIVSAMVADTAIRLALNAEAEFDLIVTRPTKYPANDAEIGSDPQQQPQSTFWPTYTGLRLYLNRINEVGPNSNIPTIDTGDMKSLHPRTRATIEFAQVIRISMLANWPAQLDKINKEVIHMFKEAKIRVGTVFAVQMHLDILDALGKEASRPCFDLTTHFNKLIGKLNKVGERESPFNPQHISQDAYHEFSGLHDAMTNGEEWVNRDGYDKQWKLLLKKPKVASHPVLRLMVKEKNYFLSRQPVLCGMIKYDLYLRYHAAGLRHEYQSLAICSLAHIYVAARLEGDHANDRVWPDMEFALYAQDPTWLFVGGLPQSREEAQKKFLLACGSPATNSASDIDLRKLRVNVNKLRDFREVCINPKGKQRSLDGAAILSSFADWLDSDMPALYFDWYELISTCEDWWSVFKVAVERFDPDWDRSALRGNKPAQEPTIDILLRDKRFPFRLERAYELLQSPQLEEEEGWRPKMEKLRPKPGENIQEAGMREIFTERALESMLGGLFGGR
ncbi:hypothetical protein K491DRAFT_766560 [Lophiostoma macrostomum CBS 122681]|uniref:DUF6604 domain-containing protein n=1 Tax=Lophiostoma macrostomum CBS 122681 TaxID=1314788 RepID=A0A6A6TFD4_9PLEO|nr:hypothetical protein K491DRAFT_766560 [Lophiostoma macrostomum CBS 122681]